MDANIELHAAMDLIEAYTEEEISSLEKGFYTELFNKAIQYLENNTQKLSESPSLLHKLIKFLPGESVNNPSLDKILSYLRDNHLFYTDDYHIQANPALSKAFLEHIVNGNERVAIKLIAHDFPFYHSTLKVAFALDRKETIYAMTSKRLFNKTLTAAEFTQELADRKKLGENLLTYVKNSKNSYIIKTLVDSLPELAKEIESFAYQQIQMDCQKAGWFKF